MKLNLGYSTSFPINYNAEIPEYSVENKNLIDTTMNHSINNQSASEKEKKVKRGYWEREGVFSEFLINKKPYNTPKNSPIIQGATVSSIRIS